MVFLSSSAWKWQAEPLKQQVTRWLLTHSLQRWAVLCKAHAGEQLRQHDGSISEKVREKADGGSRHHPGLNWSDLDSWIADFLGYRCASTLKSTHFWPHRPHSLSHFMFDCDPGATMSVVLDLSFSVCVWISAAVAIIYTSLGGLYSVAYTDVIQISLVLLSLGSFFFFFCTMKLEAEKHSPLFWFCCVISSPPSGCVCLLFWRVAFTPTSPRRPSTTHIRPPGSARWSLMTSGGGSIIF